MRSLRPGHSRRWKRYGTVNEARIGTVVLSLEESGFGERIEDLGTGLLVHCPQTLCLEGRELQARHLEVFAADAPQELLPRSTGQLGLHGCLLNRRRCWGALWRLEVGVGLVRRGLAELGKANAGSSLRVRAQVVKKTCARKLAQANWYVQFSTGGAKSRRRTVCRRRLMFNTLRS